MTSVARLHTQQTLRLHSGSFERIRKKVSDRSPVAAMKLFLQQPFNIRSARVAKGGVHEPNHKPIELHALFYVPRIMANRNDGVYESLQ